MPSLGAEVARFHIPPIPPTEFLVLLLVSPALGVIAGAVAYAIAKQSDRRYMSMVQEGHLALLKEAHHAANIYMKVDGEILEFRSTRTDDPVNGANGSQLPKPQKGPVISFDDPSARFGASKNQPGVAR